MTAAFRSENTIAVPELRDYSLLVDVFRFLFTSCCLIRRNTRRGAKSLIKLAVSFFWPSITNNNGLTSPAKEFANALTKNREQGARWSLSQQLLHIGTNLADSDGAPPDWCGAR